ncbi:MAG TPA: glycosyltransferase family 4 protein [Candidatus Binataceae bacterium]|nr:glycosyltransferase family 4 protein [Candidatus Binataceae bacterium]
MKANAQDTHIKVFVHLGHGFGGQSWTQRQAIGAIPGLNDHLAYGYYRASGNGWSVEYSEDERENALTTFCRLALRRIIGFDLIHAWRNRKELFAADIVWTHTEIENLAVLFLFRFCRRSRQPKVIANCVWLFDRWPHLPWPKRFMYRELLKRADAVTTFSPANIQIAKKLLPSVRCEYIRWGATIDDLRTPSRKSVHHPLRIAALGNDIHRDWKTVISAFGNRERYKVAIASRRLDSRLLAGIDNVTVLSVATADDVKALYEWADIVLVSLKPNLHASGITVVLEAVILGVPVVCTDSGGLRAYFSSSEIYYVPIYAPIAMRAAVEELARDDERRWDMVIRAQRQLLNAKLTTKGFAERHRRLSEELLAQDPRVALTGNAARGVA